MKQPLKSAVRDLFDDVQLSPQDCANLHATVTGTRSGAGPLWTRRRVLLAAASVSGLAVGGHLAWRNGPWGDPIERTLEDLVHAHTALRPLQVRASSLEDLRPEFAAEGFVLQKSAPMAGLPEQVLGARHCWLLRQPAAEIRYGLPDGTWATVMQAAYVPAVFGALPDLARGDSPLLRLVRGLQCRLWCDMGLVFAKARPA